PSWTSFPNPSTVVEGETACMLLPSVTPYAARLLLCGIPRSLSGPLRGDQAFTLEQRKDAAAPHQADERGRHGNGLQRFARRWIADSEVVERYTRPLPLLEQMRNP